MTDLNSLLVGGIPLLIVIFGLVEFSKSLGLKGRGLTIFSMILGVVFGMAFRFSAIGFPPSFGGWFEVIIFGLALGLTASGLYDFANARFPSTSNLPPYGMVK